MNKGMASSIRRFVNCSVGGYMVGTNHLLRQGRRHFPQEVRQKEQRAQTANKKLANRIAQKLLEGVPNR